MRSIYLILLCLCTAAPLAAQEVPSPSTEVTLNLFNLPPAEVESLWKWKPDHAPVQSLAVIDQCLYALSPTAGVWRLSDKGRPLWHLALSDAHVAGSYLDYVWITRGNRELYAVDKLYGYIVWTYRFEQPMASPPFTFDQFVWVLDQSQQLWRLDVKTGHREIWEHFSNLSGPYFLGASEQRQLALAARPWCSIAGAKAHASEALPMLPPPHPRLAHWTPQSDGVYYVNDSGHLTHWVGASNFEVFDQTVADQIWILPPYVLIYSENTQSLRVFKNRLLVYTLNDVVHPQGAAYLDNHILVFYDKGELAGINDLEWRETFTLRINTWATDQPVCFSKDTAYFITPQGEVAAAVVLLDLF